ncbi:MAG: hypothetical protein CSA35_00920 [Dethiosulfovibrio peptidovorans]|nr:MAG: hypothetical protein CSA35_00920 [Dethiosulfovibrio peptidovorans]
MQIAAVIAIVALAAWLLVRRFSSVVKNGGCGCGCDDCGASCASADYIKTVKQEENQQKTD